MGISATTLTKWRDETHSNRYDEIRARMLPRLQQKMTEEAEYLAIREADLAHELLDRVESGIGSLTAKDAALALVKVETAKAINVDKSQLLRGNPTQIVEKRDPEEILRSLAKRFPQLVVEGTAEELPSPQ